MNNYKYSAHGITAFLRSAFNEAIEERATHILLSVGDRQIKIPLFPETFECMEEMLWEGYDLLTEDYPEGEIR